MTRKEKHSGGESGRENLISAEAEIGPEGAREPSKSLSEIGGQILETECLELLMSL